METTSVFSISVVSFIVTVPSSMFVCTMVIGFGVMQTLGSGNFTVCFGKSSPVFVPILTTVFLFLAAVVSTIYSVFTPVSATLLLITAGFGV